MKCASCDEDHDITDMDPTFAVPDEAFAMSEEDRATRLFGSPWWIIMAKDGDKFEEKPDFKKMDGLRGFIRIPLEVAITDRSNPAQWGVWVEVAWPDFDQLMGAITFGKQPPLQTRGTLANNIKGPVVSYPTSTVGLPVDAVWDGDSNNLLARFLPDGDHPFQVECREGVSTRRLMEWLGFEMGAAQDGASNVMVH